MSRAIDNLVWNSTIKNNKKHTINKLQSKLSCNLRIKLYRSDTCNSANYKYNAAHKNRYLIILAQNFFKKI